MSEDGNESPVVAVQEKGFKEARLKKDLGRQKHPSSDLIQKKLAEKKPGQKEVVPGKPPIPKGILDPNIGYEEPPATPGEKAQTEQGVANANRSIPAAEPPVSGDDTIVGVNAISSIASADTTQPGETSPTNHTARKQSQTDQPPSPRPIPQTGQTPTNQFDQTRFNDFLNTIDPQSTPTDTKQKRSLFHLPRIPRLTSFFGRKNNNQPVRPNNPQTSYDGRLTADNYPKAPDRPLIPPAHIPLRGSSPKK